jgi:hypothetical protein
MDINKLSSKIIGAAIEVHKNLGPGLLEFYPVKYRFIRNWDVCPHKDGKIREASIR